MFDRFLQINEISSLQIGAFQNLTNLHSLYVFISNLCVWVVLDSLCLLTDYLATTSLQDWLLEYSMVW